MQGCEGVVEVSSSETREEFTIENEVMDPMTRDAELEISLHAIMGTPNSSTMRLQGQIGGESIVFLIDLGSKHNFIDGTLLPKLKLRPKVQSQLIVRVVNGEILKSLGLFQDVDFKIQGNCFKTSIYALNLGGCDVVLAVYWLSSSGPIICDFFNLLMYFQWADKCCSL